MATVIVFAFIFCSLFAQCHCVTLENWTLSDTIFPVSSSQAICGYNSIAQKLFVLGGIENKQNLMSFDLSCNKLTTHSPLSLPINCYSQCYAQYGEKLYFVQSFHIGVFNMNSYDIQYPLSPTLNARGQEACVTISEDGRYLFIVSGRTSTDNLIKTFQIFDTYTESVIDGPTLSGSNCCLRPSCMMRNGILWSFGGYTRYYITYFDYVSSINVSDIQNIASQLSTSHAAILTDSREYQRSVIFGNVLYNIGGSTDGTLVEQFDEIAVESVIDTALPLSALYQCSVSAGERMFVTVNNNLYWTNTIGSTLKPTNYMICDPTRNPTTRYPTITTQEPSYAPTEEPSYAPTESTQYPTEEPSANAIEPSIIPTHAPTRHATIIPTTQPLDPLVAHLRDDEITETTYSTNNITLVTLMNDITNNEMDPINLYLLSMVLIAMISILVVAITCVICFILYRSYWKPRKKHVQKVPEAPIVRMASISGKHIHDDDVMVQTNMMYNAQAPASTEKVEATEIVRDDRVNDDDDDVIIDKMIEQTPAYGEDDDNVKNDSNELLDDDMEIMEGIITSVNGVEGDEIGDDEQMTHGAL